MNDESPIPAEFDPSEFGEPTRRIEAVVIAVIPEYRQTKVRDAEGNMFSLTRKTRGIDYASLYEGQRVDCVVTLRLARVLFAKPMPTGDASSDAR